MTDILPPAADPPTVEAVALAVNRGQLDHDELLAALELHPLAMSSTGVLHVAQGSGSACRPDMVAQRTVYASAPTCGSCARWWWS